jgi:hypothetical protein
MSPVYNKTDQYFEDQDKGNNHLRSVNELCSELAHAGAPHHLTYKSKGNYEYPNPRGLVVEALQAANSLLLVFFIFSFVFDYFSSEGASLALLAYDLKGRCNDGDEQGYEPQTQNHNCHDEEDGGYQIVGIGHGIE